MLLENELRKKVLTLSNISESDFDQSLSYLEKSNKIHIDKKDGRVVWIWNPKGVDEILKKGLVIK